MRAIAVLAVLAACETASPDPGLDAILQVANAQYRPGAFPVDEGGPAALALATRHQTIAIGSLVERAIGTLEPAAHAAVFGVDGIDGAWLVPAGLPDFSAPDAPTATAIFGLADSFPPGEFTLRVAASDAGGRFGAPATVALVAEDTAVTGELVIGLSWDGPTDLDLHVIDGLGGEAWSDKPNTMPPPVPGEPVDPLEYLDHGILDHDGNAGCHRDGRPSEHVIWTRPPPAGAYVVRVDTRAMCGAASEAWTVTVHRNGELLYTARGLALPDDVLQPHGAGAGVLALRFSL
jgi:hypothetical protein